MSNIVLKHSRHVHYDCLHVFLLCVPLVDGVAISFSMSVDDVES